MEMYKAARKYFGGRETRCKKYGEMVMIAKPSILTFLNDLL